MVLVDTSIWVPALRGHVRTAAQLQDLLTHDQVLGHPFVYGELFIGDSGDHADFFTAYEQLQMATVVPHGELVTFVRTRRLMAQGLNWIDAHLVAATLIAHARLWTADGPLRQVALTLGVAYQATG
jgi:predicted nucleic acid-binding protein